MASSIDCDIIHQPDFALLRVRLKPGERINAEPSAMASMDTTITMKTSFKGGLWQSVTRGLGGESFFVNTFTAEQGGGEITLAPGPMGTLIHYRLSGATELLLQRGAYLANSDGIEISGSWQGARGFFAGEGLILLRAKGEGDLFFNTYGGLIEIDVDGGYIVDTGYIVAFENTLAYSVGVLPGSGTGKKIKSFIFGGEALVCHFSGRGKLWVQTRAVMPFLQWVWPYRPVKSKGGE
jgi:uncharacterized protein (TIGR00266 family)